MKFLFLSLISLLFSIALFAQLPTASNRYFSPNLDSRKDTIDVPLKIKENKSLAKWKVLFYEKKGAEFILIRSFESTSAVEIQRMTAKKFLTRVFQKKQPVVVPENVAWDGVKIFEKGLTNISEKAADGVYYFQITAADETGNKSVSPYVPIVLDTVTPVIETVIDNRVFSPNADGAKETAKLSLKAKGLEALDTVRLSFVSADGKTAAKFTLKGSDFISGQGVFNWDGKDEAKKDLPEGRYEMLLEAEDLAANLSLNGPEPVKLVRTIETAKAEPNVKEISPNSDGDQDSAAFNMSLSSSEGLEKWELKLYDAQKTQVRSWSGDKRLPEIVIFDGMAAAGKKLADGNYTAELKTIFDSGNTPVSPVSSIIIDTAPPAITVKPAAANFIPIEGAAGRKVMEITQTATGRGGETYSGVIRDESGASALRVDFGEKLPAAYVWDGRNQSGDIVPGKYTWTVEGADTVGNKSNAVSSVFELVGQKSDISLNLSRQAFSPNADNLADSISFTPAVSAGAENRVNMLKVDIQDSAKKSVKVFSASAFQKNLLWDGRDDSGKVLADGRYTAVLSMEFSTGEKPVLPAKTLFIDTKPVSVKIVPESSVFSPNADGNLDNLTLAMTKNKSEYGDAEDKMWGIIQDISGKIFKKRDAPWTGELPDKTVWNGMDQNNNETPEGEYVFVLKSEDFAGNISESKTPFTLVRKFEDFKLTAAAQFLSLNPQNTSPKTVDFVPSLPVKNLSGWQAVLLDSSGRKQIIAKANAAETVTWNGVDADGKKVEDGRYFLFGEASYANGNKPATEAADFTVDSTPPEIRIATSPEYFSPDGDGVDEVLNIGVKISDNIDMKDAALEIFRKVEYDAEMKKFSQSYENYSKTERPLKKWNGNGAIDRILAWDGKGDEGGMVESANDYLLFATARDKAGNLTRSVYEIPVDVFVERLANGDLKIIINSINFETGKAYMLGNYEGTLSKLVRILRKFPAYKIKISGHTDSRGADDYNMRLSLERAKTVQNYLVKSDIAKDRLTVEGKGKTELYIKTEVVEGDKYTTEENWRKNRRVEFYLIKEQK